MNDGLPKGRLLVVVIFFIATLGALLWRMFDLTVFHRDFLQHQGDARSVRVVNIPAYRGIITDREGSPLAVSTPVQSVWVNPKVFSPNRQQLSLLAKVLNLSEGNLRQKIAAHEGREFVYLRRHITPMLAKKIKKLNIQGINFQNEFKRYYPQAETTAQLIGFTNIDDDGIEGIELAYQQWLKGITGKKRIIKDRLGRVIEALDTIQQPRPGNELRLSIDRRIQYFAYHELQATVDKYQAKSGSVVVLDTHTGEVLAIVNAPSFNPNARSQYSIESYRNRAITDVFEPGSVMKPFSVASALASGLFKPDSVIDTRPSWIMVEGHPIRDGRNYGVLDVTGVLQHSSNVGVTKMVLASPPEQLIGLLKEVGIGQRTISGYPGENDGILVRPEQANTFVLATLGFGYGLSLTTLQLAKSYLIFAKEGALIPIQLLHYETPIHPVQILPPHIAKTVLHMMEAVVNNEGTGKRANVPGYRIAGKTGTARIAGADGYEASRHVASFVGIAPVSKPRLIVAVVINEPGRYSYYGGQVAAPLFAKIMGTALRILNIKPDKPMRQ